MIIYREPRPSAIKPGRTRRCTICLADILPGAEYARNTVLGDIPSMLDASYCMRCVDEQNMTREG